MNRSTNKVGIFLSTLALLTVLLTACGSSTPATIVSGPTSEPVSAPTTKTATMEPTEAPTEPAVSAGTSPEDAVPLTGMVLTPDWEIQVLEVIRGEEAMALLEQTSAFNKPHEAPGMEYALVRLRVKNIGSKDTAHVYGKMFRSMDSANEIYDSVSSTEVEVPEPGLEADLTPGQETEGWIAVQSPTEAAGLKLVVWPYVSYEDGTALFDDSTGKWYISLE